MSGLLGLRELDRTRIEDLLDLGEQYGKQLDGGERPSAALEAVTVAILFFEPSTRTRLSFEKAARHLSAEVLTFTPGQSSTAKGESLKDTALTLAAMGCRILVVRHGATGAPRLVAGWTGLPVVNAGDGRGEHPTQALADALTLRQHFGGIQGLRVAIVGDVRNSRVARSLLWSLPRLGADVVLVGPPTLLPTGNPWAVKVTSDFEEVLPSVDVAYMLRIQLERGGGSALPGTKGYAARFGLTEERLSVMAPSAVVMHPGPINRGVEICDRAADGPRSLILRQVGNGVPMRMAVLDDAGSHR